MNLRITPPDDILQARTLLPLSKSISNRALAISAFTPSAATPISLARCDDTDVMAAALADPAASEINIGAAGTAMRFLTAFYAATERTAPVRLDGSERMRRRPIGPLVDALRSLGASIEYAGEEGYPPLVITGRRLPGGAITVPASISSQYISALLMAAPTMTRGLTLTLEGEIMSMPYIRMTLEMMTRAGAAVAMNGQVITVEPHPYSPTAEQAPEADWSAAAFWYELVALSAGWVTLEGGLVRPRASIQGDAAAEKIFGRLGVTTQWDDLEEGGDCELSGNPDADARLDTDLRETPDLTQPIVVTCAMLGIPFSISGLDSLRIKETDRLEALRRELLKIGVAVEIREDILTGLTMSWDGARKPVFEVPAFDTYEDHRMAMAFAPVAVMVPGIVIRNAEVVAKSYPEFWEHLAAAGFTIEEAGE